MTSPKDETQALKQIGTAPARGFRDILPKETALRDRVLDIIIGSYRSYGFDRIEAPMVEDLRRLRHSEGGENLSLIFEILKRGEKFDLSAAKSREDLSDLGLRYDLTVPLAR